MESEWLEYANKDQKCTKRSFQWCLSEVRFIVCPWSLTFYSKQIRFQIEELEETHVISKDFTYAREDFRIADKTFSIEQLQEGRQVGDKVLRLHLNLLDRLHFLLHHCHPLDSSATDFDWRRERKDIQAAIQRVEALIDNLPLRVPKHLQGCKQELLKALTPKETDGKHIFLGQQTIGNYIIMSDSTPETRLADFLAYCGMPYEWMVLLFGQDVVHKMRDNDVYRQGRLDMCLFKFKNKQFVR